MGRSYEKFQEKGEQSLCFQKGTFFWLTLYVGSQNVFEPDPYSKNSPKGPKNCPKGPKKSAKEAQNVAKFKTKS